MKCVTTSMTLFLEKPVPLVPRDLRLTVNERIGSEGEILVQPG